MLRERSSELAAANDLDLAAAPEFGLSAAQLDRLRLTPKVVESMATALEEIAMQRDPISNT